MKEQLRTYILDNFMFGASPDQISDEGSLLDAGILDSTSVLELVMHLEEFYGITIESAELVPENLDSLVRLERFLERKGVRLAA